MAGVEVKIAGVWKRALTGPGAAFVSQIWVKQGGAWKSGQFINGSPPVLFVKVAGAWKQET